MRRWWMAFLTVLALSVGVARAEGKDGKTNADGKDCTACCCCAKSCPK